MPRLPLTGYRLFPLTWKISRYKRVRTHTKFVLCVVHPWVIGVSADVRVFFTSSWGLLNGSTKVLDESRDEFRRCSFLVCEGY